MPIIRYDSCELINFEGEVLSWEAVDIVAIILVYESKFQNNKLLDCMLVMVLNDKDEYNDNLFKVVKSNLRVSENKIFCVDLFSVNLFPEPDTAKNIQVYDSIMRPGEVAYDLEMEREFGGKYLSIVCNKKLAEFVSNITDGPLSLRFTINEIRVYITMRQSFITDNGRKQYEELVVISRAKNERKERAELLLNMFCVQTRYGLNPLN